MEQFHDLILRKHYSHRATVGEVFAMQAQRTEFEALELIKSHGEPQLSNPHRLAQDGRNIYTVESLEVHRPPNLMSTIVNNMIPCRKQCSRQELEVVLWHQHGSFGSYVPILRHTGTHYMHTHTCTHTYTYTHTHL